jgi:hypothetical protein
VFRLYKERPLFAYKGLGSTSGSNLTSLHLNAIMGMQNPSLYCNNREPVSPRNLVFGKTRAVGSDPGAMSVTDLTRDTDSHQEAGAMGKKGDDNSIPASSFGKITMESPLEEGEEVCAAEETNVIQSD